MIKILRFCVAFLLLSAVASAQSYEANIQLTIDSTAGGVSFTSTDINGPGHPQVNSASCTSNSSGGTFRYRVDGGAPTTTVGVEVPAGGALVFDSSAAMLGFKGIRTGGTSAVLSCTFSNAQNPPVVPVGASGGSGGGGSGCVGTAGTPCVVVGNDAAGSPTAGTVLAVQGISGGTAVTVGDGSGALNVICDSGCSGGTQYTQDSALTVATSVGTMAMGRASAAAPTDVSADNDAAMPWYLRNGAQATVLTAAGALIGGDASNGIDVDVTRVGGTVTVAGNLSDDTAAPAATNVAALNVVANAADPSTTEGRLSFLSVNLANYLRTRGLTVDADDASIAVSQTNDNVNGLSMVYDGSVWRRFTIGTAGTASTQVVTVQGIASGTPVVVGDGSGALNVICDSGCSGGTQYTQDAALTVATTVGTMAMGRASAAVPTDVSADNDAVIPWFLRSGAQASQPTFGGVLAVAGNGGSGTGVQRVTVANDSTGILAGVTTVTTLTGGGVASGSADSGNPVKVGGRYNSSAPTLTNGQRGDLQLTATGALVTAPSLTGAFATDCTHDGTACTTGPQVMAYAAAAGSLPSAVAAGDATRVTTDLQGVVYTRRIDPCSGAAKSKALINIASATTTEIINAVASNKVYICSINIVSAGANNVALVEDATNACASPDAGMAGGTTAATGWNFAANGGIAQSGGGESITFTASANVDVCLITSGSGQVSGVITYVLAP